MSSFVSASKNSIFNTKQTGLLLIGKREKKTYIGVTLSTTKFSSSVLLDDPERQTSLYNQCRARQYIQSGILGGIPSAGSLSHSNTSQKLGHWFIYYLQQEPITSSGSL